MTDDFRPDMVSWVLTVGDLRRLDVGIEACGLVVMDLETTGLDEHAWEGGPRNGGVGARVSLASLTLPERDRPAAYPTTWAVPLSHPDSPWSGRWRAVLRRIALIMLRHRTPWSNQNVKFDARWIYATTGVDLSPLIDWDTKVSQHLLDENSSTRLKDFVPRTFKVASWADFDLSVPGASERVPLFDLGMYAARDTYWTWRADRLHREQMLLADEARGREPATPDETEAARLGRLAVWCSMPTTATLTSIEQRGIDLDTEWTRRELAEHRGRAEYLTRVLAQRFDGWRIGDGRPSFAPTSHWFVEWARRAVEAGELRVAEMTGTGKPSWTRHVLVRQARAGSVVAEQLLELRGHTKKMEFLTSWLAKVTPEGLIHTTYNAGSVVTGRLSSEDPNLQQVTASLRPAFGRREGWVVADLDLSQIELRVAAHVSDCQPMIEAFRRGDDLHRLLASRITGKPPSEVLPEERADAKPANFGLLYGLSAYGFREYAEDQYGVSFTPEEAEMIHRTFFETWTGLQDWYARTVRRAQQTGQVTSPIGRVRRLPNIMDANAALASYQERAAINSPVQGFASDLTMLAAASIEGHLPGFDPVPEVRLVATVHDDLVALLPERNWKELARECMDRMLGLDPVLARMDCRLKVPLAVEAKVGTAWGLADVGTLEASQLDQGWDRYH